MSAKALHHLIATAICAVMSLSGLGTAAAQNAFAPVIWVNDRVITTFELDQRKTLMGALGTPGNIEKEATDALINERLMANAAKRGGFTLTAEEQAQGEEEFASRGGLDRDQFLLFLEQNGVAYETFRDFVRAGLLWRKVVRADVRPLVNVTQRDVALAVSPTAERAGVRYLFSEIYLPARNASEQAQSQALAKRIAAATTLPAFASLARQYSVAPTRNIGGRVNWIDGADMPPVLQAAMSKLAVGEIAGPIAAGNVLALFQLRGVEETGQRVQLPTEIDYAIYYIDGGQSPAALARAAKLRAEVQTCNDLYGVAKGQPPEVLIRETVAPDALPGDVALEIAKLDDNEISTALTRNNGQTLAFLMLCERKRAGVELPDAAALLDQLRNQQLGALADNALAELRANAVIRQP